MTIDEEDGGFLSSIAREVLTPETSLKMVQGLKEVVPFTEELILEVHPQSRQLQILSLVPLHLKDLENSQPIGISCVSIDETVTPAQSENEYVGLGDVAYEKLLKENKPAEPVSGSHLKKILDATTSEIAKNEAKVSSQIDQMLSQDPQNPSDFKDAAEEEVLDVLAKSLSREQLAEIIKRDLTPEQVNALLAKAAPQKLAELLFEKLSEEERETLILENLTDEQKAQALAQGDPEKAAALLKSELSKDEIKKILTQNLDLGDQAELLAKGDPEKSAELLQSELSDDQLSEIVCDNLDEELQAQVLNDSLSKQEMAKLLESGLSDEKKASLISEADPAAAGKLLNKTLEKDEVHKLISESLSDEEKAKSLAEELSSEEVSGILSESLSPVEQAKLVATLSPKETVERLKKKLPPDEISELLSKQLTDGEKAKLLLEGLSAEESTQLLTNGLSDREKAKALASGDPALAAKLLKKHGKPVALAAALAKNLSDEALAEALMAGLDKAEIAELLGQGLSKDEKIRVLAKANPKEFAEAAESALADIPKEELLEVLQKELPAQEVAKAALGKLPKEEVAQLIKGSKSEDEIKKIIGALAEEELAQIVKGSFEEKELARMVKGQIPEEEIAQLVKGSMSEEEMVRVVKGGLTPEELAQTVVKATPREKVADLVQSAIGDQNLNEMIAENLSKEALAEAAASTISSEELRRIAGDSIKDPDFAKRLAGFLSLDQIQDIAVQAAANPEMATSILRALPPDELSKSLKSSERYEEIAQIAGDSLSNEQIKDILTDGLDKQDLAQLMADGLTSERSAEVFNETLNDIEIARTLTEGLDKEKLAELMEASIPKPELSRIMIEGDHVIPPNQSSVLKEKLDLDEFKALLDPKLTQDQATEVLSQVLPAEVAEGVFNESVSASDIEKTIADYLPEPSVAPIIARKIAKLAEKAAKAETPKTPEAAKADSSPAALGAIQAGKTARRDNKVTLIQGNAAEESNSSTTVSAKEPKASLEAELAAKLNSAKMATEFYLARTRALEKKLQDAEAEKRKALQDADRSNTQLESILSKVNGQNGRTGAATRKATTKASDTSKPMNLGGDALANPEDHSNSPQSAEGQGPNLKAEALKFFQKKSMSLETDLRKAESEIKRLKAEHKKELLTKLKDAARSASESAAAAQPRQKSETDSSTQAGEAPASQRQNDGVDSRDPQTFKAPQGAQAQPLASELTPQANGDDENVSSPLSGSEKRSANEHLSPESQDNPEFKTERDDSGKTREGKKANPAELKVRELEIKLRKSEEERQNWIEKFNQAQDTLRRKSQSPEETPENDVDPARSIEKYQERIRQLQAKLLETSRAGSAALTSGAPGSFTPDLSDQPDETKTSKIAKAATPAELDVSNIDADEDPMESEAEVAKIVDSSSEKLEKGLENVTKKLQSLKEATSDKKIHKSVDGMLGEVYQERIKLNEASKELAASIRKKELSFATRLSKINEQLKQANISAEQKESNVNRMKLLMLDMQRKFQRDKTSLDQYAQMRVRFDQNQRQIDFLQKEVQRLTRSSAGAAATAAANAKVATESKTSPETKKLLDASTRALTAKKQELETLKKQLADREAKETEFKRTILKLQNELNSKQAALKKTG
jgi:hypothetical protein